MRFVYLPDIRTQDEQSSNGFALPPFFRDTKLSGSVRPRVPQMFNGPSNGGDGPCKTYQTFESGESHVIRMKRSGLRGDRCCSVSWIIYGPLQNLFRVRKKKKKLTTLCNEQFFFKYESYVKRTYSWKFVNTGFRRK